MKTKLVGMLAAVISLGTAGAASAADMAVKARPLPPPVPVFTWTGCFIGGNVGGLWADKSWNVAPGDPSINPNTGIVVGTPFGSHTADGWMGGVQAGCDYQFAGSNWVIGIQGDYDWADARGRSVDFVNNTFFGTTGYFDETKVDSIASVTGRLGYAWNRLLGYVRGGYAWERDKYYVFGPANAFGTLRAAASETRGGWTVGVGGEYAFTNNVSAFVEYNYYDFGTRRNSFYSVVTPNVLFDVADIRETKSVVKGGINFRWGPGGAVVAKY